MAYTRGSGMLVKHVVKNAKPNQYIAIVDTEGLDIETRNSALTLSGAWDDYEVQSLRYSDPYLIVVIDPEG